MNKVTVELDGYTLSIEDIIAVVRKYRKVNLTIDSNERISKSAEIVKDILSEERKVYGVTTGFGYLQEISISKKDAGKLQQNLITSHAAGVGSEFPHEIVRGMMVLQLNKFARGHSGIQPPTVSLLMNLLNNNIIPVVPSKGSLGASGDLAPLAHLSLILIGKGIADFNNERLKGIEALKKAGLEPVVLKAKEGLALLNGTQAMTAIATLAVYDADYLVHIANLATALSMEIHQANIDSLHPKIHQARPHVGQIQVAKSLRDYLSGSKRVRQNIGIQDSYSLRCVPVVHGASLDTISYARKVVEIEINSSTDNPLIFSPDEVFSGGNFHGQPIALIMDYLGIAVAELGNISERRIERLVNPSLSGLPAFLTSNGGLNSGYMIAQYTAASLVSENKGLAFPASIDSIPVSANQEDHVSMGTIAARQTRSIIANVENIIAIELLCACQAVDLAEIQDQLSPVCLKIYSQIRKRIPMLIQDRELAIDIESCVDLIRKKEL
jgi:histidine ammonia-lyase